jgi:hypothetical protein
VEWGCLWALFVGWEGGEADDRGRAMVAGSGAL